MFEGKRRDLFAPSQTGSVDFESSWLNSFALPRLELRIHGKIKT